VKLIEKINVMELWEEKNKEKEKKRKEKKRNFWLK